MTAQKSAGQIIRNARRKKNLTQVQLAEKIGVHPNTIARIERGVQKPNFSTVKKLATALGINEKDIPA